MSIHPKKLVKNDYKYFKAVIGVLSKEFDYLGRPQRKYYH
jgi:hypothetical protein